MSSSLSHVWIPTSIFLDPLMLDSEAEAIELTLNSPTFSTFFVCFLSLLILCFRPNRVFQVPPLLNANIPFVTTWNSQYLPYVFAYLIVHPRQTPLSINTDASAENAKRSHLPSC